MRRGQTGTHLCSRGPAAVGVGRQTLASSPALPLPRPLALRVWGPHRVRRAPLLASLLPWGHRPGRRGGQTGSEVWGGRGLWHRHLNCRAGRGGSTGGRGGGAQPHPPACPPSPSPSCGKVGGGDTFPSLSDYGVSALRVAGWTGTWRFARQAGAPPCVPYIPLAQGPRPTPTGSHSVQTLAGGGWGRREPTSVSLRPARCPGAPPRERLGCAFPV